jgi:hypothetical protein
MPRRRCLTGFLLIEQGPTSVLRDPRKSTVRALEAPNQLAEAARRETTTPQPEPVLCGSEVRVPLLPSKTRIKPGFWVFLAAVSSRLKMRFSLGY